MFYHHGAATTAAVSRGEGKARQGTSRPRSARALMSQDADSASTTGSRNDERLLLLRDGVHLAYGKRCFRLLCCSVVYAMYGAIRLWRPS